MQRVLAVSVAPKVSQYSVPIPLKLLQTDRIRLTIARAFAAKAVRVLALLRSQPAVHEFGLAAAQSRDPCSVPVLARLECTDPVRQSAVSAAPGGVPEMSHKRSFVIQLIDPAIWPISG